MAGLGREISGRVPRVRHFIVLAFTALTLLLAPATASASEARCTDEFPGADWESYEIDAPVTLATAGMNEAMSQRFAADVTQIANLTESEIGGLEGTAICLATPELAPIFSDFVSPGQRLHVGVFAEEKLLALSAVEIRMVDDAISFGVPQIALWSLAEELGLDGGYPDPLGSTIAHWYLARQTDRLDRYRTELVVTIFLDDPNPEERTTADALDWVGETKPDPYLFDPQFIGSQMGVFIDFAVAREGVAVFRATDQATWAELERSWRISIRDEFPRGSYGVWWGVAIVVGFLLLAVILAWTKRRSNRKAAERRPTAPADESLFVSQIED